MYDILADENEAFARLTGYSVTEFNNLYRLFLAAWQAQAIERRKDIAWAAAPGAGRKFAVSQQNQLLAVFMWAHLSLHPKDVSRLLKVHVSTFARIRHRALPLLSQMETVVPIPSRNSYQTLDELADHYPELVWLVR